MSNTTLEFIDHTVTFETNVAAKERVWNIALKWFRENELWSGECICQCDDGLIESLNLPLGWLTKDLSLRRNIRNSKQTIA